jgi:hypothetical protein
MVMSRRFGRRAPSHRALPNHCGPAFHICREDGFPAPRLVKSCICLRLRLRRSLPAQSGTGNGDLPSVVADQRATAGPAIPGAVGGRPGVLRTVLTFTSAGSGGDKPRASISRPEFCLRWMGSVPDPQRRGSPNPEIEGKPSHPRLSKLKGDGGGGGDKS